MGRGTGKIGRLAVCAALVAIASGCTTATPIHGTNGTPEILISCGAASPTSVCHDRAAKECPAGYTLIDEDKSFNRKEIRVSCH